MTCMKLLHLFTLPALLPLFLMISFSTHAQARPLSPFLSEIINGLSLEAIKEAGPSPGDNHAQMNGYVLGGMKDSEPSPWEGHAHANEHEMKKSNGFPSKYNLGGMKDSSRSPGVGHSHIYGGKFASLETIRGRKESGPSPGEGHGKVDGLKH